MADFININGIDKRLVHEQTSKDGKPFVNVGITVPNEVSRNGIANIALSPKMVRDVKDDPSKVNIGIPKDWKLNVSVASYYNSEKKEDTKYKRVEMTPDALASAHIEHLKARKDAQAAKAAETPEAENDGPELG